MTSMSYCRHENTPNDMGQVVEMWHDFVPREDTDEDRGRAIVIELARAIVELAEGTGEL